MIDSGASVNVCLKWFGESILQEPDGSVQFRGADGRTLQDYGKCQIWLKIGTQLRQYDFHVVEVTKLILLCENGTETHLAKELFFEVRRHTRTLDQVNGVYFVKAQNCSQSQVTSHAYTQEIHRITSTSRRFTKVMRTSRRFTKFKKYHAHEQTNHKSHACELTDCKIHKSQVYEHGIHKKSCG